MKNNPNIVILGTGAYGLALGHILKNKSNLNVTFFTTFNNEYDEITKKRTNVKALGDIKLDQDLDITMDLNEALTNKDIIIVAVPCNAVRSVLTMIASYLNDDSQVILISKGLEEKTAKTMSQIFIELNLKGTVSYLAGPSFAKDLFKNAKTALTLASNSSKTISLVKEIFKPTTIKIEITNNYLALELYGAIKNILAILMGSINCKYQSDTTKAYYLTALYNYANTLVTKLTETTNTAFCYGALGDIFLTCNSKNSRNYLYGTYLYQNKEQANEYKEKNTVEGILTASSLHKRLINENKTDDILDAIVAYFNNDILLDEVLNLL